MTSRVLELSQKPNDFGECVIYIMARDQRVSDNHALLEAQAEALKHNLPLLVVFNLLRSTGHRTREHYEFMIEGLKEVEVELQKKDIPFIFTIGNMPANVSKLAMDLAPRSIYFDFSPLRGSRAAQKKLASLVSCRVAVVDTHNIIPTWVTSDKEEFAAHTIRRKIHKLIEAWAHDPDTLTKHPHAFNKRPVGATWDQVNDVVSNVPKSGISHGFTSGENAAKKMLKKFIESGLDGYASSRNDALADAQSNLSPYLHYGQLSALRILLDVMDANAHPPQIFTSHKMPNNDGKPKKDAGIDSFIEELVVRKELADNFCLHNTHYDSLAGARDWAKKTLKSHKDDAREFTYSKKQLELAQTHDDLWNAAQTQLTSTGKIHGYMRMYWAKMFLAWTNSPETAVKWAVEMNDKYHLDGGDPNGYVGVLWSIAGVHDRPWFDRSVFGTIRYMAKSGAEKKFDTDAYIKHWLKKR